MGDPCELADAALTLYFLKAHADVAELADAQVSGTCSLTGVEVRSLSSALNLVPDARCTELSAGPSQALGRDRRSG